MVAALVLWPLLLQFVVSALCISRLFQMSPNGSTYDCVLIGGGVIGLSLAYELARTGMRICVLERGEPGREASWAGAGILPPGADSPDATPMERLIAEGSRRHAVWAQRLREVTGIDNGYQRCGGYYVARKTSGIDRVCEPTGRLMDQSVDARLLNVHHRSPLENALGARLAAAIYLPSEAQIRNPRHLQALLAALSRHDVTVLTGTPAESVRIRGDRIEAIETREGRIVAAEYCLTAGCWSTDLARQMGLAAEIKPIRGQMVLLKAPRPPFEGVVNCGLRYLVPRDDGRILVGSTMEDAGFDAATTARGIRGLLKFALSLAPRLADCAVEKTWAGLRPATADGLPILGRIPGLENGWIAAGHFRNGLTLSTVTAEVLARLISDGESSIDLAPFSPARLAASKSHDATDHRGPLAMHGA
jgi:glycine oxidase